MLRIIRHAKQRGCFLELNAHPERLDLLDSHCQSAKEEGVLVSINSDAHSTFDFANLQLRRRPGAARLAGKEPTCSTPARLRRCASCSSAPCDAMSDAGLYR